MTYLANSRPKLVAAIWQGRRRSAKNVCTIFATTDSDSRLPTQQRLAQDALARAPLDLGPVITTFGASICSAAERRFSGPSHSAARPFQGQTRETPPRSLLGPARAGPDLSTTDSHPGFVIEYFCTQDRRKGTNTAKAISNRLV